MGGPLSGGWRGHEKRTTPEECLVLDAARLVREGLLTRDETSGSLVWTNAVGVLAFSAGYSLEPAWEEGNTGMNEAIHREMCVRTASNPTGLVGNSIRAPSISRLQRRLDRLQSAVTGGRPSSEGHGGHFVLTYR